MGRIGRVTQQVHGFHQAVVGVERHHHRPLGVPQLAFTDRTGQSFANGMKAAVLAPLGMGEPAPSMHLCSEALSGSSVAGLD